jgi:type I restriction-modification system DNA methylase subunit
MARKSTPKTSSANLGFEHKLWLAADKLRNNMDAAEYKHVVLGLIFLKYISDSFEARPPLDIEQAHRLIAKYVNYDNTVRLHSAIGYITPQDKLLGKDKAIFAARDQKVALARR